MLMVAAAFLGLATLLGVGLLALYQWGNPSGRIWFPGVVHGVAGLIGVLAFVLIVRLAPDRDARHFGLFALVMFAAAVVLGLIVFAARLRRQLASALVLGMHITLAAAGAVMFAAYWYS